MINLQTYTSNNQIKQKDNKQVNFGLNLFNRKAAQEAAEAEAFRQQLNDSFDQQLELVKGIIQKEKEQANPDNAALKTDARHVLIKKEAPGKFDKQILKAFDKNKTMNVNILKQNGIIDQTEAEWIQFSDFSVGQMPKDYAKLELKLKQNNYVFDQQQLKKLYCLLSNKK